MGAAAVLVLAVAVTVHMERVQPERVQPEAETAAVSRAAEAPLPPERWLERIVQLRKEGRHEEADKQLAELRRTYPEYKVPRAALR